MSNNFWWKIFTKKSQQLHLFIRISHFFLVLLFWKPIKHHAQKHEQTGKQSAIQPHLSLNSKNIHLHRVSLRFCVRLCCAAMLLLKWSYARTVIFLSSILNKTNETAAKKILLKTKQMLQSEITYNTKKNTSRKPIPVMLKMVLNSLSCIWRCWTQSSSVCVFSCCIFCSFLCWASHFKLQKCVYFVRCCCFFVVVFRCCCCVVDFFFSSACVLFMCFCLHITWWLPFNSLHPSILMPRCFLNGMNRLFCVRFSYSSHFLCYIATRHLFIRRFEP